MIRKTAPITFLAFLATLLALPGLVGCGNFIIDDPPETRAVSRRVYVNDKAVNDSLRSDLVRKGVKFVLQPGRSYEFSLGTPLRTGDKLNLYHFNDGSPKLYQTLYGTNDGSREIFPFVSDRSAAEFFMAQIFPSEGTLAIAGLGGVTLASASSASVDTLLIRLLMVRTLQGLPDSASKAAFARELFREMALIYSPLGIVLKGTFDIVEGQAPALVFPFNNYFVPLPGNRARNHAHMYLVDSISIGDPGSGLVGEVLGFAPREVIDIDEHRESRVLLSNPRSAKPDLRRLAITATHELGHFFGLRHTVSTRHDFLQDEDYSNAEDGFNDTRMCDLGQSLAKRNAAPRSPDQTLPPRSAGGEDGLEGRYCLRIADRACTNLSCDLLNLMHPVDCGSKDQTQLTGQQISFLKRNLANYRR